MKTISGVIYFDQIPKGTSQMKRVNHRSGAFFEGKELREARKAYYERLAEFAPETPLVGPIHISLGFNYATKDKKKKGMPNTSRPDCDNLVKLVLDVMTDLGFWEDDSYISQLYVSKAWSNWDRASVGFYVKEVAE